MKLPIVKRKHPDSRSTRIGRVMFNRMFPKRLDALKVAFSVELVFLGIAPTIEIAVILTVAVCAAKIT